MVLDGPPDGRGRPRGAAGASDATSRRRRPAHHVQLELVRLDAQLVELRLVDQPQDLAHVRLGERHQVSLPAPKVFITSDSADCGARASLPAAR